MMALPFEKRRYWLCQWVKGNYGFVSGERIARWTGLSDGWAA
jgi:hypothetical protein